MNPLKRIAVTVYGRFNEKLIKREFENYTKSLPQRIADIRQKDVVKVGFLLHEVSLWKTEELFISMLQHPRFQPIIYTTITAEGKLSVNCQKYNHLLAYLNDKGYEFEELTSINEIDADLIFYEKPYDVSYFKDFQAKECPALIAYIAYGINNFKSPYAYNLATVRRSIHFYVENELVKNSLCSIMDNNGKNVRVTGTPIMDVLSKSKDKFADPWKISPVRKKRIIWAPHHTISGDTQSWLKLSSFLSIHEGMLSLAEKYASQVQFAFKPHPLLFNKLIAIWGKEKTIEYYNQWSNLENAQLEEGEYIGLFKHSDAMIHDCGSFLIEYLYTGNPVMYMVRDRESTVEQLNEFGRLGLEQVYEGSEIADIEKFINDIIADIDPKKVERKSFYDKYLIPSNGKTACENIISAILGIQK